MPDEVSTSRMENMETRMENMETKFQENCIRSEMSKLINNACQSVYANKRVITICCNVRDIPEFN